LRPVGAAAAVVKIADINKGTFTHIYQSRSVNRRLNEWRNDQWSATLESLDPEDQSL
jgi:hypothetical protein